MLEGDELCARNARFAVALGVGRRAVGVADREDVDRLECFGQAEFAREHLRLKVADPSRAEAELRRGEHHVVGQDRGVDVGARFLVVRPHPSPAAVRAGDHGARGAVYIGGLRELFKPLGALHDEQADGLGVRRCGRYVRGLQNRFELLFFHRLSVVIAHGIALFGDV